MGKMEKYISLLIDLLMSLPFNPAAMKVGPSHRINAKVNENAQPDKANDTTNGAPSSLKTLKITTKQQETMVSRVQASVLERVAFILCRQSEIKRIGCDRVLIRS